MVWCGAPKIQKLIRSFTSIMVFHNENKFIGMPETLLFKIYILQKSYSFQAVYILDSTYAQRYIQSWNIDAKAPVVIQYNHVRMINVVDTVKLIKFCFVYAIVLFTFSFASFFLSSSPPSSSSSSSSLLPKASNNLPSNNIKQL